MWRYYSSMKKTNSDPVMFLLAITFVIMFSSLSLPPKLYRGGLTMCDVASDPPDEGPNGRLVEGQGVVAGGGDDDPLPGGNVLISVSPTQAVSRWP